jgi:tetratricopeptide (TPR) repeat protein
LTVGRLTGGFAWVAPGPIARRAREGPPPKLSFAVAALELRSAGASCASADALATRGVGLAALGDLDRAIVTLEEAIALDASRAAWWSDLAAIRLTRAVRDGHALELPQALEDSSEALARDPSLREASFNRALALTRLGLRHPAADAWSTYLSQEVDPAWRAEAATERAAIAASPEPDAQSWREQLLDQLLPEWASSGAVERRRIESTLPDVLGNARPLFHESAAAGYRHYGVARRHYAGGQLRSARHEFAIAVSQLPAGNRVAGWASYYVAVVDYLAQDLDKSLARLDAIRHHLAMRKDVALQGHVGWLRGMALVLRGQHREALVEYRAASENLRTAGEHANAAFVAGLLAEEMDWLGDPDGAWESRLQALRSAPRSGTLLSAAGIARMNNWLYLARAIQTQAVKTASGNSRDLADSLRAMALTSADLGDRDEACETIEQAEQALAGATDAYTARQHAELDAARAESRCGGAASAMAAATRAITFFARSAVVRLPDVYASRAALHRRAGRTREAAIDLEAALADLEAEAQHAPRLSVRASFGEPVRRVTNELVSLRLDGGEIAGALAAADRSRSLELRSRIEPLSVAQIEDLPRRIGPNLTVLFFQQEPDRLLRWHIAAEGVRYSAVGITADDLAAKIGAFTRNPSNGVLATELRDVIFDEEPSERVVIIPDGALHVLPFAMTAGWSRPFAIEETTLSLAPSLAWVASRARKEGALERTTIVANPAIDRAAFPRLPDLPGAAAEGARIAGEYPRAITIAGENATHEAVVRALVSSQVVHFAGHALFNEISPAQSQLVVADSASRPLTAQTLALLDLRGSRLVVLAACEAASGRVTAAEGPLGLARALVSAGTESVVGSLWAVDDSAAARLFPEFHARLRRTADPATALRESQLSLLRSQSPALSDPRAWGGFLVVYAPPLTP